MLTRRSFIHSSLAASAVALFPERGEAAEPFPVDAKDAKRVEYKYQLREMEFETQEPPGTIVVDSRRCFLYLVLEGGRALRYGCSLGRGAKAWKGEVVITKKAEWPVWRPAPYHLAIKPELAKWKDGMPGGPDNPMGARAMYLTKGNVDTLNRIHGAAKVNEIGTKATAGCIGMLNIHVIDLYDRVELGTRVVMI